MQLRNAALPLAPNLVAATRTVEALHMGLGQGFRQAVAELCAPNGQVPMLKGALVTTLLRQACNHYALGLAQEWRRTRAALAQVWQLLLRRYACAPLLGMATQPGEDGLLKRSRSCGRISPPVPFTGL